MAKIDFKKEFKNLYNPPANEPVMVEVPTLNYLMIDGAGDPNTSREAREAIEALFSLAYSLKFIIKKQKGIDYGVMPLEGLWWTDDMAEFSTANKDIWKWTYMIMQPEYINKDLVNVATAEVKRKKNLPALPKIRFAAFEEGLSAQIIHIGPFSEEGPTIEKLHKFIEGKSYTFDGLLQKHHEIYLSDIRKVSPEKMKTVLRQPVVSK